MQYSLYVVDDEISIRKSIYHQLKHNYKIKDFSNAEDALACLPTDPPDLILLDIGLPGISGIEALKKIKDFSPNILVIMSTAHDDIETVIAAMKIGAYDYITKPLDIERLKTSVHNALQTIKLSKDIQLLQQRYLQENMPGFICESDSMQEVMTVVSKVAQSFAPVMILGESGTGKELIAGTIHYQSPYFRGPFIALNCAAIPIDLIESELFGYEKGAFSGAAATGKKGQVEMAANGTLFLDEVGDLSQEAQAKLLRFLEQGEFYRIGSTKKIKIATRVISATNKDIQEMIATGKFRKALFYRLAIIKIEVPPLNERRKDILPIAKHFLATISANYGKKFSKISPQVEDFLLNHRWQGNVRELRNLIEKGVILGNGPTLELSDLGLRHFKPAKKTEMEEITPGAIPISTSNTNSMFPAIPAEGIDLAALEKHYIDEALKMTSGNDTKAAKLLKMSYHTFRYRKSKLKT